MGCVSIVCAAAVNDLVEREKVERLISVFNSTFYASDNTLLVLGADEPIYLPADKDHDHHRVIFAHGFFSSALHEISHWLVAGKGRRHLEDYGYWYKPDGRSAAEQQEFEKVEVKPQAIEWILSVAAGHRFNFSADNLTGEAGVSAAFKQRVLQQAVSYLNEQRPANLSRLLAELSKSFNRPYPEIKYFVL